MSFLPLSTAPSNKDWNNLATYWKKELDSRISFLQNLSENMTGCIGCGCLSLDVCKLYNPDDIKGQDGPGPRNLMG